MKIIEPYLVDKPYPLIGAKTIQLIVMREILDYTVLRTEEDRQLNTVYTPLSVKEDKPTRRVAFLATKQKAAESRQLEQLLRPAAEEGGLSIPECYLKDKLCMKCPGVVYTGLPVQSRDKVTGPISSTVLNTPQHFHYCLMRILPL